MPRERFSEGDHVTKHSDEYGVETGTVVKLASKRTGRPYLSVWISTGPRKNQREFPELGWMTDDGRTADPGRPAYEDEGYSGSEAWKTRRHSR